MKLLTKPLEENGIMSYALLRLYMQTEEIAYLDAGIKTLGHKLSTISGLDPGYYYIKTAQ